YFQAEDSIREPNETGVQTCALPILQRYSKEEKERERKNEKIIKVKKIYIFAMDFIPFLLFLSLSLSLSDSIQFLSNESVFDRIRSEERRVGKVCLTLV